MRLSFLTNFNKIKAYLIIFKIAELAHVNQNKLSYKLINPTCLETVLLNDITIYSNEEVVKALNEVINYHDI